MITIVFWAFFAVMIVCSVFRFFGWGYFAAEFRAQEQNTVLQFVILGAFKWLEGFFIILALSKIKCSTAFYISFFYTVAVNLLGILGSEIIILSADLAYIFILPFFINKMKPISILHSLLFALAITVYQFDKCQKP